MAACSGSVTLTDENFRREVIEGTKLALVVFWADWCGSCHIMASMIEEMASHFQKQVKVGKLDIDHHPRIAAQYGIRSTPTLLFFKDGHVVDQVVGVVPRGMLTQKLRNLLQRA